MNYEQSKEMKERKACQIHKFSCKGRVFARNTSSLFAAKNSLFFLCVDKIFVFLTVYDTRIPTLVRLM